MITHLEPDILECVVKWVLGSITKNKASGGYGIPVELFFLNFIDFNVARVSHPFMKSIPPSSSPKTVLSKLKKS